jgi:hypothetical protein
MTTFLLALALNILSAVLWTGFYLNRDKVFLFLAILVTLHIVWHNTMQAVVLHNKLRKECKDA